MSMIETWLVNSCGYHVNVSLPNVLVAPKIAFAMASPPDCPGYPHQMSAWIALLFFTLVTSTGPAKPQVRKSCGVIKGNYSTTHMYSTHATARQTRSGTHAIAISMCL